MILKPSAVIGPPDNPYMLRWHVVRIAKLPRVYVHKFMRSDDDRTLHDHPWWFVSILLKGSYVELRPGGSRERRAPSVAFRSKTDRHRIVLTDNKPWTLFITGRVVRKWGFWCPRYRERVVSQGFGRNYRTLIKDGERFVAAREFDGCE